MGQRRVGRADAVRAARSVRTRPFLELALAGEADALTTGDKNLLALADTFPIPIMSPTAALATLPAP